MSSDHGSGTSGDGPEDTPSLGRQWSTGADPMVRMVSARKAVRQVGRVSRWLILERPTIRQPHLLPFAQCTHACTHARAPHACSNLASMDCCSLKRRRVDGTVLGS